MAETMFIVFFPGSPHGNSKVLKICFDRKQAEEVAERFVVDNGGLGCQLVEVAILNAEKYPKKESENG